MTNRLTCPPPWLLQRDPADILARTIYGEARGELIKGKEAIAAVVLNRVKRARGRGYWWGNTIVAVCLKPWQFSCWNAQDPNRVKVMTVGPAKRAFQACQRVARRALQGRLIDPTRGATHYHAAGHNPPWAHRHKPSAIIGRHQFLQRRGVNHARIDRKRGGTVTAGRF